MKKISKIILFLFLSVFSMVGCSDLLDVNSDRMITPNEYTMSAANDTMYSMFAIYSQLQKLADSYVLLGELRGDLMDVTPASSSSLKEINDFDISTNNPYTNNIRDYYSVINNCNYVIHNIDTSLVKASVKVMLKEYAACKAIRAWTYMQIALNYGSAIYYDKPILSEQDGEAIQKLQPLTLAELAPILIADITPFKDVDVPQLGWIFNDNLTNTFFPIRFITGDLYLWTGQYENAANEYHDLMLKKRYIINLNSRSTLEVINHAFTGKSFINWFVNNNSENITNIAATNQYGQKFDLDSLTLNRMLIPSDVSIANWQKQIYFQEYNSVTGIPLKISGDLRINGSVLALTVPNLTYEYVSTINTNTTSINLLLNTTTKSYNYLAKYFILNAPQKNKNANKTIVPYRVPLLYLRYAEAVNRLGKPNLAMAVLKNGLNSVTLANRMIIPSSEIADPLPNYMNFNDLMFNESCGIRMRGCGNADKDTTFYRIPGQVQLSAINSDSIKYVEDLIVNELALESAFEGNRFQDLMRVAIRRDDNSYLANLVAAKHTDNKEAIRIKLSSSRDYWYLKK
jgi:hypothetical protein